MDRKCVRINLPRLADRLSRETGRRMQPLDARFWLHDNGFELRGDSWYCDSEHFSKLLPSEIREVVVEEKEGGVTYIRREPRESNE